MLTVAYATIQWISHLEYCEKLWDRIIQTTPLIELITLSLTTYLCYAVDMGTGIVLGVMEKGVVFSSAWNSGQ